MKQYWIGVDGGGTKTAFALAGADGTVYATARTQGTSYRQYGLACVVERVRDGVQQCLTAAAAQPEQLRGMCLGMPCYGESAEGDVHLRQALEQAFFPIPVYVCNDVEVGWAGSLACHSGINVVAGTGAIAFGRNSAGLTARSSGWCEFFGDEGSCYWVGRRTMELFSKQADGRLPRAALYHIVREALSLKDDFDFLAAVEQNYAPYREKTAAFQRYTEQAALAGDTSCINLYELAAAELAAAVSAVRTQLQCSDETAVSYSGGLFRAGELILRPFRQLMQAQHCILQQPMGTPVQGAVLLALEKYIP